MSESAKAQFVIKNQLGLHARAATKLVQTATKFPCEVEIEHDGQSTNAKSVMGVLLLCGAKGTTVEVRATGVGAQACIDAIGALIDNRFGEPS
jgi:phosphocarrier protein HPr